MGDLFTIMKGGRRPNVGGVLIIILGVGNRGQEEFINHRDLPYGGAL